MEVTEHLHPQTRRSLINKERLRISAIKEFARHGLAGAKVSTIVANADLTQPSFYRLWPSKEAAYNDIIEHTVSTWHRAADSVFNHGAVWTPDTLLERIEYGTTQLFAALTVDLDRTKLVIQHQANDTDQRDAYLAIYDQGFADLQRRGILGREPSSEVLAQTYFALTERFYYARLQNAQSSPQAASREVAMLMVSILSTASPTQKDS